MSVVTRRCSGVSLSPWVSCARLADITSILAQELDHPTKVMFFVGRGVGGDGEVLPWMWFDEDLPTEMPDVATPLGTRSIVVSSPADLEAARAIQERDGAHDIAIRVRPTVELLREREFVDELASFAKEHDSAVEIEGSILSHVFYMLNAAGVRVRCVDPLQAKQRSELFDKLVRDEIPEKIRRHGESVVARIAHGSELDRLLRQKAVEEALELNSAVDTQSSIEELADVLEVVRSLAENLGLDLDAIVDMADNKAATRGGFARGVVLLGTNRRPMLSQRHDRSGRIPETDVEPDWLGHNCGRSGDIRGSRCRRQLRRHTSGPARRGRSPGGAPCVKRRCGTCGSESPMDPKMCWWKCSLTT